MLFPVAMILLGTAMLSQNHAVKPVYTVHRVESLPLVTAAWDAPEWAAADTVTIERFHTLGSGHRPITRARVMHDGDSIAVMFRVEDRYVRARHTAYQSPTHEDSCVEFFVKPRADRGYFNFEFNAIGTLLLWYVEKPRGPDGKFQMYSEVPKEIADGIEVHASMSGPIENEIDEPTTWTISYRVPIALFEEFTGPLGSLAGQMWTGNFYKCGDKTSHPHWGYWADVGEKLDFHQPDRYGRIVFE
jgi:hypothetical protein